MKKHLALVDSENIIYETLEINDKDQPMAPQAGFRWVEVKNPAYDFHKDPEKFHFIDGSLTRKHEIGLDVSSTKAFDGDSISVKITLPNSEMVANLNVDGHSVEVKDGDTLNLHLEHPGTYQIYSEDNDKHCNQVIINVMERV